MKNIVNLFLFSAALVFLFGCKKKDNLVILEEGTTPVLSASKSGSIVFNKANADSVAIKFSWTNPGYVFNTGVGSQNVNYLLEIDTVGSNFTNPQRAQVSISPEMSKTFTVLELNALLNAMDLAFDVPHRLEFRLRSAMLNSSASLYSNIIPLTITPYLDTKYPVPANLWIVGSATPNGWDNPTIAAQKFSKVGDFTFEITITLKANEWFVFIPDNDGKWAHKYVFGRKKGTNERLGDEFVVDSGEDIIAPASAGTYKITVDFKMGRYTLVKQ